MAGRRPQVPTMPSATRRAPGLDPGDLRAGPGRRGAGRPVPSLSTHSRFGRARPGLDPHRLDPPGHPDPLARHDRGDRRGRPGPLRPASGRPPARSPGRSGPSRRAHAVDPGPALGVDRPPIARRGALPPRRGPLRPTGRRSGPARRSGRRTVEGDDGGAHVGHLAQDGGDLVGRAVVQEALPDPGVAAPGQQHGALGVAVERGVGHQLDGGPAQAPVGALDDVERQAGQPEPAPLLLELAGLLGVDVEVHGAQVVGRQRAGVLQGPRRGHVEAVDEHHDDVAAQDRRLGRLGHARSRASRPRVAYWWCRRIRPR